MDIIIDKSYLEGSTKETIEILCNSHRVMMPDTLFYELVTTTDGSRQRCFAKIPKIENPLVLIPSVSTLLIYENETRMPCVPIYKRRLMINYKFNEELASGEFQFTDEQRKIREYQIQEVKNDTQDFIDRVDGIEEMFTEFSDCKKKDIPNVASKIRHEIVTNFELIKEIYGGTIGQSNLPINVNPKNIGRNWAILRWVQIQLLYSLEFYTRYQGEFPKDVSGKFWTRVEHDMLDSHYIVLGVLAGGLASRDNNIIDMYTSLKPNGLLIS